jgi:trans-2,3-dihydro-3-hydroxyanthranilate isomerase
MVLVLEEKVGPVRCGVTVTGKNAARAIFDVPVAAKEAGPGPSREAVAAALGLARPEIGFENHLPTVFNAGVPFVFVPVRDLAVIGRARPVRSLWEEGFGAEVVGAFLYCRETQVAGRHFHARMFAPSSGIDEDPATGAAVAAFVGVIRRFDGPPAGSHHFVIEQGFEMGRPSLIGLEMDMDRGEVVGARVGGDAVKIADGELDI